MGDIPAKITDQTGTPCASSDSSEVGYMQAVMKHLGESGKYDTKRVFTSGCSMGSAFSGYMGNCLKQWDPTQISAFATHSTGLKYKGDGNKLPTNWGECSGCQWWPFAPVKYTDSKGLKACIFDNTGDGDFYKTSTYLAQKWPQLGNPSESHFASGGHCQNIPYEDIVKCLDISGSSPTPTPSPRPHPLQPRHQLPHRHQLQHQLQALRRFQEVSLPRHACHVGKAPVLPRILAWPFASHLCSG